MSVERFTPIKQLGSAVGFSALGVPPGTSVQPQVAELLRDVAGSLGLPEVGVVTPWAGREGDLAWREVESPDTNVALFELTDAKIHEATEVLFGTPLPFVTVIAKELSSIAELQRIVANSPYDLFETQAVYRQEDPDPVPEIYYLHWLRVKDVPDIPRDATSMDVVAREMKGSLMFGQQVPVESSTVREPPAISFEDAFRSELPSEEEEVPAPPPDQQPVPEPTPQPSGKVSMLGPFALGVGVLAATVAIGRAMKK